MAQNIAELYKELKIPSDQDISTRITKLEDWIRGNISTDCISNEQNLDFRLEEYEELLSEYFTKRNFSIAEPDLLPFATANGLNILIDSLNLSPEQLQKVPDALISAAAKGYLETVKSLLSKGLTLPSDSKILHAAIALPIRDSEELKQRKEEIVKILVEKFPALLAVKNNEGNTVFHTMAENDFHSLISYYLNSAAALATVANNIGQYPLVCAVLNQGYDSVKALLQVKDIETLRNSEGRMAVHFAAKYGDANMMSLFTGATLNAQDSQGRTPLHYAAESNDGLVELLLNQPGIDINAKDSEGKTPLDYASDESIRELLLKHGAIATQEKPDYFENNLSF